ncbi:MAG TPA: hypothetical protein VNX28_15970 [Gemmataceae bacterium]|jgi:hypothetical protein|nr:hypothetical protein [Gemmataceae bacterium]
MRGKFLLPVAFVVLLGMTLEGQAGDEALAIIDKAVLAHGLKGKEDQTPGYLGKNKGTLHVAGMDLEFTQDILVQAPNKFKEVMELSVMGNKITVTTVFDGKQGWIKAGDNEIKVENEILNEFKEIAYAINLAQSLFLKDKSIKLGLLGEAQVKGKPALGIRVSKQGQKEISFYFDKATGLMAKMERRAKDVTTGQEVTEERIILEYQDVGGRKVAKKAEVLRDGNAFVEAEVLEARFVDKLGDNEFAKPE